MTESALRNSTLALKLCQNPLKIGSYSPVSVQAHADKASWMVGVEWGSSGMVSWGEDAVHVDYWRSQGDPPEGRKVENGTRGDQGQEWAAQVGGGKETDLPRQKKLGFKKWETNLRDIGDVDLRGRGKAIPGIFFLWPQGAHGRRTVSSPKNIFGTGALMGRKGGCQMSYI